MKKKLDLRPPTDEEYNRVVAKRLFGDYAEKILENFPWSILIVKRLWKNGEEPWER